MAVTSTVRLTLAGKIRRHFRVSVWLALGLWLIPVNLSPAPATNEYQIKAAFLYNFAQFVEWPATAFTAPESPLIIGILGDDPFGSSLDELVQGESANSRPLLIRRFERVEDIVTCHILFLGRIENNHLESILAVLQGRSILTVGDSDNFATRGGMIRFVTENKKIRLRINLTAARAAHLTISSKLLRPAEVINSSKN